MASNRWYEGKYLYRHIASSESGVGLVANFGVGIIAMVAAFAVANPVFAQTAYPSADTETGPEVAARKPSWRFEPTISIRETYTDNVALVRGDGAKSEFITEIIPGFSIRNQGARSDIDIVYNIDNQLYLRDKDRNTLNHQLRALGDFEFVEDLFYLDTRASISQQAVSAFGPIGSNSSTNNNKQSFRSYSLSPYLRKQFGRQATGEARYTFSQQSSNGSGAALADSTGNSVLLKLDSGPAFQEWGWGAAYTRDQANYDRSGDATFESVAGNLRYRINPRLFATGSVGYDRNDYLTSGKSPEGSFWTIGADWRPLRRTSLTLSAGRRYFGTTYALGFQHTTRRTAWDISYQQNLTTSRSQFNQPTGTYRDFVEATLRARAPNISEGSLRDLIDAAAREYAATGRDPDAVQGINFQTNTAFVEKKWQGLFTVNLPKSLISFTAFNSIRDTSTLGTQSVLNSAGDFALSRIIKQSGISSQWTYHLSARNDANLGIDYSRSRLVDISRTDDLTTFNLGITRKLSPTANGSVGYRFVRRDSNFDVNDFDENAFFGALNLTF